MVDGVQVKLRRLAASEYQMNTQSVPHALRSEFFDMRMRAVR